MRTALGSNLGEADFDRLFDSIIGSNPHLNNKIREVHNESNVFLCLVLRIYPYEDKAWVRILNNDNKVFELYPHGGKQNKVDDKQLHDHRRSAENGHV